MNKRVFLCAGGDLRFLYMCTELEKLGEVYRAENGSIPCSADVLVLPMTGSLGADETGAPQLAAQLKAGGLVVGGRMSDKLIKFFSDRGFVCEDYFTRESLVLKNCIPTAEGALQIALNETTETVFGSHVLLLGFGRTAKCCARLFRAAGAECTVAARRPETLAEAWCEGYDGFDIKDLKARAGSFDIIINTVPAMLLTEAVLECCGKNVLVIDLASKPGGTDFAAAKKLGIKAVHALALPAKTAPAAAGRLIAETIEEILNERGN